MPRTSRFECASSVLTLRGLLRKTRRVFWICAAVGIAAHLSFTQLRGFQSEQKAARPLTTQFVKRQPRLTKPLELKKRPQPKRRRVRREMVAVEARADQRRTSTQMNTRRLLRGLARPTSALGRPAFLISHVVEPSALARVIGSSKEARNTVDASLDLLSVDALDTGQHHAMVIQDPRDKRSVRGFFHVARAYPQTVGSIEATNPNNRGSPWALPRGVPGLVDALNKWTRIKADMRGTFTFDSRELFKTPMVFIASHIPFRLTRAEAETLGQYLLAGGFLYTDTLLALSQRPNYHSIVLLWKDSLAAVGLIDGRDWELERLPQGHAVYHCYFDFDRAPNGHDDYYWKRTGRAMLGMLDEPPNYLEGGVANGRLLGICTAKNYTFTWGYWPRSPRCFDNTRQLQLGINLVVFALTQEGSITQQVMHSVD